MICETVRLVAPPNAALVLMYGPEQVPVPFVFQRGRAAPTFPQISQDHSYGFRQLGQEASLVRQTSTSRAAMRWSARCPSEPARFFLPNFFEISFVCPRHDPLTALPRTSRCCCNWPHTCLQPEQSCYCYWPDPGHSSGPADTSDMDCPKALIRGVPARCSPRP